MMLDGSREITRADLAACRSLAIETQRLRERIEELDSAAECVTRAITGMPRSQGVQDRLAAYVARKQALQERLLVRLVELEERRALVEDAIAALPHRQRLVMRLRYIDGARTWREIARVTHYGERHCKRLHAAALARLQG